MGAARARIVIIGGGFAGATCARYLRRLDPSLQITLLEPNPNYIACPFSNLVLANLASMDILKRDYRALEQRYGVQVVHDRAEDIDAVRRRIRLKGGMQLEYDRLVVAPGIRMLPDSPAGYDAAAMRRMPHAWEAGEQTRILRDQLAAMPDGGTFAIAVPPKLFRCPPGPYERASLIAWYLKQRKPRSKVLILDGNEKFSKQDLFEEAWALLYPGLIERVPFSGYGAVVRVDAGRNALYTEAAEYRVAVANVIPSQSAGEIAIAAGLADATGWCPVDPHTLESTLVSGVHVLGDASIAGPIPKSASAANSQAKICALAIAALLYGETPPPALYHNTCYSLVAPDYAISISGIYRAQRGEIVAVEGAGGLSPLEAPPKVRVRESEYARGWFASILADSFGADAALTPNLL